MGHGSSPAHRLTVVERREIARRVRNGATHAEVAVRLLREVSPAVVAQDRRGQDARQAARARVSSPDRWTVQK
jgi:hypothetical protein